MPGLDRVRNRPLVRPASYTGQLISTPDGQLIHIWGAETAKANFSGFIAYASETRFALLNDGRVLSAHSVKKSDGRGRRIATCPACDLGDGKRSEAYLLSLRRRAR
jgi:hypothetical protein